jgi:hypothetical protein
VYVVVEGATVDVDASDDAVHSNGAVHINAGALTLASADDGIHADAALFVDGGDTSIATSYEGLESAQITIDGGTMFVRADDDGVNASSGSGESMQDSGEMITISGGDDTAPADGDGFDSNGSATMTGGTLSIWGPTGDGNGAIDVNGTFDVSGGTLLAAGSAGMAMAPTTDSAQGWVFATVSGAEGATVQIVADGAVIAEYTATKAFSTVVYSGSGITAGSSYDVVVDGAPTTVTAGEGGTGGMGGQPGGGQGGGMPGGRPSEQDGQGDDGES